MPKSKLPITLLDDFQPNSTGHDILRYLVLPDLLGHSSDTLLYFSGRKLARKIDIHDLYDIYYFFQKISWGNLALFKENKNELSYFLISDYIVIRFKLSLFIEF